MGERGRWSCRAGMGHRGRARGRRCIIHGYTSYWLAAQLCRRLPLPFAYWVGLRFADRFFRRDHAGRAHVVSNLRRIYGHRGIRADDAFLGRMARKTYQYFGKYLVDFFHYSLASREEIERRVTIAGLDRFTAAAERGRGVILASAHFGNWELGGLVMSLLGHTITTVYRPFGNPRIDRMFEAHRASRGFVALPLGGAVRGLASALRRGGITALLADRDFSNQVEAVPFFGDPARLPRGPAVLAARMRACLVPTFLIRGVDDHYVLQFDPPIDPLEIPDAAALQGRLVESLEHIIGAHPHQWFIFDDFWRGGHTADATDIAGEG